MFQMELPELEEQPEKPSGSVHNTIQSLAAVITAFVAVAAAISSSRNRTITLVLIVICVIAVLVMLWPLAEHTRSSVRKRKRQAAQDQAAMERYPELLRLARRFAKFTNPGDPTNIVPIIQSSCANDIERYNRVCPPDYMRDLFPVFLQQLETRPPENERQFLLATQELYVLIASYNREYVSEPFRKMRLKIWPMANPSVLHEALGNANPSNSKLGPWLYSLPQLYQDNATRQIEDFRERWSGFLDDTKEWLEKINEVLGANLHTYFERPQKL